VGRHGDQEVDRPGARPLRPAEGDGLFTGTPLRVTIKDSPSSSFRMISAVVTRFPLRDLSSHGTSV